jgi:hypothetical protein
MVIKSTLDIGGTVQEDVINMRVNKTSGDFNAGANFQATLDSPYGRHSDDFTVGQEVTIRADKDPAGDPTTKIFVGILEEIRFSGKGTTQKLTLSGRDFIARIMDATVEPIVYSDQEISTIVTNIMDNEVDDVTTNNVQVTGTTLSRISFNQQSVFEALKQLSDLSGFYFYVDTDKDLHFEQNLATSSGVTINNTNIRRSRFDTTRTRMANKVWVYGDRYLTGFKEFQSADGGSVFTLVSKPHNTRVETSDNPGSFLNGTVFEFTPTVASGFDYAVSFDDKQVIFLSGTDLGYSTIPTSGGSVIIAYEREVPIVKFGQDDASISAFGPKEKVIQDKAIRDPRTATDILKRELERSDPFKRMEFNLSGWYTFEVGQTVTANLSDFGMNEMDVPILNISYTFDKSNNLDEEVISIKVNRKIVDITDQLTGIERRLEALESSDLQDTDLLTRLIQAAGSLNIVGSYWEVRTRAITGKNLIYDDPVFGIMGSATLEQQYAGSIVTSFVLSTTAGILGTSTLGITDSTFAVVRSGGFDYTTL